MKSFLRSVLFAAVASIPMSGCITLGLYETARTAAPGQFQFGGWVSPMHVVVAEDGGTAFFPFPGLYAKLGVSPGFDIGATWAMGPGLGLNGKLQFAQGLVDAAFQLGGSFYGFFGFGSGGGVGFYSLSPRLVVSSEEEGRFPIAVNGGVHYIGMTAGDPEYSSNAGAMLLAGGLGFPWRLGQDRSIRVMPQFDVNVPLFGTADYGEGYETYDIFDGALISLGISAAYVGKDRTD